MSRFRIRPSFANLTAFVALFIALGGAAYAAGTINGKSIVDHSITGKDIKQGSIPLTALKKIPVGQQGQRGPAGPAGPVGSAGAAGPAGAAGSAVAYAHVNADGTLDAAKSKNIASTKLTAQPGYYCVLPSVPVKSVIADGDGGLVGRIYDSSFEDFITSCPEGAASVEIVKAGGGFVDSAFYIVFN
jgi:hypothetical protein